MYRVKILACKFSETFLAWIYRAATQPVDHANMHKIHIWGALCALWSDMACSKRYAAFFYPSVRPLFLLAGAMLCGASSAATNSADGEQLNPKTNYLHWFQCVLETRLVPSDALSTAEIKKVPGALELLVENPKLACHGIPMVIPPGYYNRASRTNSTLGTAPGAGLELHFPREQLINTKPPENMSRINFFRVKIRPLHQWEPFFRSDFETMPARPPSRTETFLTGLRGFDKVQSKNIEENGFAIYETPNDLRGPNYGKRVFVPTAGSPDIFMTCMLQTRDRAGVTRILPSCNVRTTLDGLFEIEYQILGQDIDSIRVTNEQLKSVIRGFFAPGIARSQRSSQRDNAAEPRR